MYVKIALKFKAEATVGLIAVDNYVKKQIFTGL